MPVVIQRVPWTVQPKMPGVGIDWSNTLTRNLRICILPKSPELISRTAPVVTAGTFDVAGVGVLGNATVGANNAVSELTYDIPDFDAGSQQESTILVVCSSESTTLTRTHFVEHTESTSFNFAADRATLEITSNATGALTFPFGGINVPQICIGTKKGNALALYAVGASVTAVTGARTVGTVSSVKFGRPTGSTSYGPVKTYLFAWWNRTLTAPEINSLLQNPWKLFAP